MLADVKSAIVPWISAAATGSLSIGLTREAGFRNEAAHLVGALDAGGGFDSAGGVDAPRLAGRNGFGDVFGSETPGEDQPGNVLCAVIGDELSIQREARASEFAGDEGVKQGCEERDMVLQILKVIETTLTSTAGNP